MQILSGYVLHCDLSVSGGPLVIFKIAHRATEMEAAAAVAAAAARKLITINIMRNFCRLESGVCWLITMFKDYRCP